MSSVSRDDEIRSTRTRYHQLAVQLETAIRNGTLAPGREIENEIRLAARFGVSRTTMRRAILELVDRGLLVRRRGVGTRVVAESTGRHSFGAPISRELRLSSLHHDLSELEHQPTTVVLTHEHIRPPQAVVETLSLRPGRLAVHLIRLRYARQEPLAIMETYLPADLIRFDAFDLTATSLYQAMRDNGISPQVARQRIGARTGTDEECRLLGEPANSPILTMDRITHDDTARIVEVASHLYRANMHEYTVTLVHR